MIRRRLALRLALVTAAAVVAVACSGDDDTSGGNQQTGPPQKPDSLIAAVGANDDFVISLTDEKGTDITNLAAGKYDVDFRDQSDIHNYHLVGGDVNEETSVGDTVERTASITFEPGQYTFVCDPHPGNMKGTFTVT